MKTLKIVFVGVALVLSAAAFAYAQERAGRFDAANYAAPEGDGHADVANYAPQAAGRVQVATYAAPEGNGHADVS